jgi:hypothetical protein
MLQRLRDLWSWHEIRGCPGRFIVSKLGDDVPPEFIIQRLISASSSGEEHSSVRTAKFPRTDQDDVFVAVFLDESGGGLITFCKRDGHFVHTLNEPNGLERKLKGLGLEHMLTDSHSDVVVKGLNGYTTHGAC